MYGQYQTNQQQQYQAPPQGQVEFRCYIIAFLAQSFVFFALFVRHR